MSSRPSCRLSVHGTEIRRIEVSSVRTLYLPEGMKYDSDNELSTETVKYIIQTDGLRGMYRGLGPTILGYLPTWAIYFAVYDSIKTQFGEVPLGASVPPSPSEGKGKGRDAAIYPAPHAKGYQPLMREHPWSLHILSAMAAGASSTICTNPLWVIKTRFQVRIPLLTGKAQASFD